MPPASARCAKVSSDFIRPSFDAKALVIRRREGSVSTHIVTKNDRERHYLGYGHPSSFESLCPKVRMVAMSLSIEMY
jgi:hypothetical protein